MKTITKTVEVIEKFELLAHVVGYDIEYSHSGLPTITGNAIDERGQHFSFPTNLEFCEKIKSGLMSKIKMEITFID